MSDEKIEWPGVWALQKCCWYRNGWISDRSGWDAINHWGTTATPEELKRMNELAESMGFLTGMGIVGAILKFFRK